LRVVSSGRLLGADGLKPLEQIRVDPSAPLRAAFSGVEAAVVGLLLATRHYPVCTGAVTDGRDTTLVLTAFAMLQLWQLPGSWRRSGRVSRPCSRGSCEVSVRHFPGESAE
jgi:hypothetical protein